MPVFRTLKISLLAFVLGCGTETSSVSTTNSDGFSDEFSSPEQRIESTQTVPTPIPIPVEVDHSSDSSTIVSRDGGNSLSHDKTTPDCVPDVIETFDARVSGVGDGDTVRVLNDSNQAIVIRLEGIDAPELGQEHGTKAKEALERKLLFQKVRVEKTGVDPNKRTLAYVYLQSENINRWLVEEGWAWHDSPTNCEIEFIDLQERAQSSRRGLWSHENPLSPWDYRQRKSLQREYVRTPEQMGESVVPKQNRPPAPRPVPLQPAIEKRYWLNISTGVRHNSSCEHYANTKKGRSCGPNEGSPCRKCGG